MTALLQASIRLIKTLHGRAAGSRPTEYNEPGSSVWHRVGSSHRQRYAFAARHIAGKRVLNVACGPGYAEQILVTGAPTSLVAVDYDRELIDRLRRTPRKAGVPVEYLHADAEELPDSLGKFDVIISFENIEHLQRPERFLDRARRLLNPGGILIVSTPNRLKYSSHPDRPFKNPFHVREYDFDEFTGLVSPYFGIMEVLGQFERNYVGFSGEVEAALRALNSLWIVRLERAARRLIGKPVLDFHFLSFETDLVPIPMERRSEADGFVIIGAVRQS